MRPAFSSTKQAAAFALLLLAVLLSPVLAGKKFLPPREQTYCALGWGSGPYPWIQDQIFEETNAIDIAFMGSSHMLRGVDTPYVQAALSRKLGRPAVVRTIAWGGPGYDGLFLIARDLLRHRRVRQLVLCAEDGLSVRNAALPCLFRWGDDAACLRGLPLSEKGLFYFASLLGMPRNLLSLVRPNLPAELVSGRPGYIEAQDPAFVDAPNRLGAVATRLGFNPNPRFADNAPFVPFRPPVPAPVHAAIYTVARPSQDFEFAPASLFPWELHFAREFTQLAEPNHCQLVLLHFPAFDQVRDAGLRERTFWPAVFSTNLVLVGIPPQTMFTNLTDREVKLLFGDPGHFNQNGMEYFTPLITPALIQIYEARQND